MLASLGIGTGSLRDKAGDLEDVDGKIAKRPQKAVDLVAADIALTEASVTVGFDVLGPPPKDSGPGEVQNGKDHLRWVAEFYAANSESSLYFMHATLNGTEWSAEVLPLVHGELTSRIPPSGIRVSGRRIEVEIPRLLMPQLPNSFDWRVVTYWMFRPVANSVAAGGDRAPDQGRESFSASGFVPFDPGKLPAPVGITIRTSGGTQLGIPGAYCWAERLGQPKECARAGSPPTLPKRLRAVQGKTILVELDASNKPDSLRATSGSPESRTVVLQPQLSTRWRLDTGDGNKDVRICGTWDGHGEVCWTFFLSVVF